MGLDFTVDYSGGDPDVVLITPDDGWVLYSEVISSGAAANLGDVTLTSDVDPDGGNFTVTIKEGSNAGAADVGSLVLNSTDASWTGQAKVAAATISGSLNGELDVATELTGAVTIGGSVTGPLTIPKMTNALLVGGNYGDSGANNDLYVGEISGGGALWIVGDVLNNSASGTLSMTVDDIGDGSTTGSFKIDDVINSNVTITIGDFGDDTTGGGVSSFEITGDFGGTLSLTTGLPSTASPGNRNSVKVGNLTSTGVIDLG